MNPTMLGMLKVLDGGRYPMMHKILRSQTKYRIRSKFNEADFRDAYWQMIDGGFLRVLKDGRVKITAAGSRALRRPGIDAFR